MLEVGLELDTHTQRAMEMIASSRVRDAFDLKQEGEKKIAQYIKALASDDFEVRKRATDELEKLGKLAEPALEKHLADKPELEVQVEDAPDGTKEGTFDFVIRQVTERENVTRASLEART